MKKTYLLILAIMPAVILLGAAGCQKNPEQVEKLKSIANCLADKGVKEYGAFWCPHCAEQKKLFGEADEIIKSRGVYVECDPRCVRDESGNLPKACRGIEGKPDLCLDKGVEGYPTWEFPDGSMMQGVMQPDELAKKAGCGL